MHQDCLIIKVTHLSLLGVVWWSIRYAINICRSGCWNALRSFSKYIPLGRCEPAKLYDGLYNEVGLGECWNFETFVVANMTFIYGKLITMYNELQELDILYTCLTVSFHVYSLLTHQILVEIRTNAHGIWWGGVHMCQPTIANSSVQLMCGNLLAQGHGPPYFSRPPNYGWLVTFLKSTWERPPTHYFLESTGQTTYMKTHCVDPSPSM